MLEHHPPRRDPRLLVVAMTSAGPAIATVDAWEVRDALSLPRRANAQALEITRSILRAKPSHVVTLLDVPLATRRWLRAAARRRGLAFTVVEADDVARAQASAPRVATVSWAYPESALVAETLRPVVSLALGLLLTLSLPPRTYVCRINRRSSGFARRGSRTPSRRSPATGSSRRNSSRP